MTLRSWNQKEKALFSVKMSSRMKVAEANWNTALEESSEHEALNSITCPFSSKGRRILFCGIESVTLLAHLFFFSGLRPVGFPAQWNARISGGLFRAQSFWPGENEYRLSTHTRAAECDFTITLQHGTHFLSQLTGTGGKMKLWENAILTYGGWRDSWFCIETEG